jgi:hypothetical protein
MVTLRRRSRISEKRKIDARQQYYCTVVSDRFSAARSFTAKTSFGRRHGCITIRRIGGTPLGDLILLLLLLLYYYAQLDQTLSHTSTRIYTILNTLGCIALCIYIRAFIE